MYAAFGSGDAYRPGTPPASTASASASTSSSSGGASRFSIASFTSSSSSSADRLSSPSSSTSSSGFPNVLKRASSSVYPSSLSAGGAGTTAVQVSPSINILDRNLAKTRGGEVANAAWAFLFSEMVQYTQRRVAGIAEFEQRCVCTNA